ncbi:MAG TPA: hypothetical protein DIU39_07785 [Flavobacteriales bacterium]|nr:hypothetical protein [Flavobacteriales bacterium]|tara:strand:- start:7489 stop:8163 length:675 start_codon:yes stop_codon:yes gene_type:complete
MLSPLHAQNIKKYTIKVRAVKELPKTSEVTDILVRGMDLKLFEGFAIPYDLLYKKVIKEKDQTITGVKNGKIISKKGKQFVLCNKTGNIQIITLNNKTNKKIAYKALVRPAPTVYIGKNPEGNKIDGLSLIALPVKFSSQIGSTRFRFDTRIIAFTISYLLGNKITTYTFPGNKIPKEKRKEFDSLPAGTKVTISEIYFSYFNFESILMKNAEFTIEEIKFDKL